jgi:cytochrome c oxidase cbb3-type subunit 3
MAHKKESALDRLIKKLTKSTPIEQESEIKLDHDFDGIEELNNPLPPWWSMGFLITVIIAVFYIIFYWIMGEDSQYVEYQREVAAAKEQIEKYKKEHGVVDENTVVLLKDEKALADGKAIYDKNCAACHMADGGGQIGPNLTDDNWIYGCDIKDLFKVIQNGTSKGMPPWKTLGGEKIQKVASYVLVKLHGTKPAKAKAPEGEPCKTQ